MDTWDRYRLVQILEPPMPMWAYSGENDGTIHANAVVAIGLVKTKRGNECVHLVNFGSGIVPVCSDGIFFIVSDHKPLPVPQWIIDEWKTILENRMRARELRQKNKRKKPIG